MWLLLDMGALPDCETWLLHGQTWLKKTKGHKKADSVSGMDKHQPTALQATAQRGHLEIEDKLLVVNADVNAAASNYGLTALQAAAEGGHIDVVERLLAANADVNAAASNYGLTALQAATKAGHIRVIERLKKAGAAI